MKAIVFWNGEFVSNLLKVAQYVFKLSAHNTAVYREIMFM